MVDPAARTKSRLTLIVMPFVIMAAVIVARIAIGPGVGLLPLLALAPALAAAGGGLRHTAVVGGLALIMAVILAPLQDPYNPRQEAIALTAVVGVTVASLLAGLSRRRRDRELAEVRLVAEVAQEVLLHPVPRRMGPMLIGVRYISAASRARIGGDLYEVLPTPAGVRLVVADVEGKGLSAVQTASTVLGAFREAAFLEPDLEGIAARIETSLARQHINEHFVTAIIAQVSQDSSKIELLNCGHPPPLLTSRAATRFVGPAEGGLPLGLAQLADLPRTKETVPFTPGDCMLFYTDGITEARDAAGTFFPLANVCCARAYPDPEAMLDDLTEQVRHHTGHPLDDDAAMLLIRRDAA